MATNWPEKSEEKGTDQMSTPAQVIGYEWKAALAETRQAKAELRTLLRKAIEQPENPGNLTQAILKVGDLDDLIFRLEEVGRNTKDLTKG